MGWGGGQVKFYPYKKMGGGDGKVLAVLKGGTECFNMGHFKFKPC